MVSFPMPMADVESLLVKLRRLPRTRGRDEVTEAGLRPAAVLVPIVLSAEGPNLLFTRRTEDVETHKGQISFPGGMADRGDCDMVQTALRETNEELGIESTSVEVMGLLDDLPTHTGFIITPVVGVLPSLPLLLPNPSEVAEAFLVPLAFFCDSSTGRTELLEIRGEKHEVWFYEQGERTIWGITARIIRQLVTTLGMVQRDSPP